jgi:hypothetical protein
MVTDHRHESNSPAITPPNDAAVGLTVFAGVMMIMVGVFQAIQGVVAVFNDTFYVVGQEWAFSFDVTVWGWIHLLVGVLLVAAGFFLFRGAVWARVIGVAAVAISAVLNFMWLPYYPLWSMLVIALDVFVIWALTAHGRDIFK